MKFALVPVAVFLAFASLLRAEPIVTPAGIVDADEKNVKFNYNVETENGVETRTETIKTRDADDIGIKRLAKKLGAIKFVVSPESTKTFTKTVTVFQYRRAEAKETPQHARVRRYNNVKAKIQAETRKFYKKHVPNAVAPMGSFINEGGGAMTLVDDDKKPIGTLTISYETDLCLLPYTEEMRDKIFPRSRIPLLEEAESFLVRKIPSDWKLLEDDYTPGKDIPRYYRCYILPSGEKVLATRMTREKEHEEVKKIASRAAQRFTVRYDVDELPPKGDREIFWRCYSFVTQISITYTYEKLRRRN